jgi:hypothetical protein
MIVKIHPRATPAKTENVMGRIQKHQVPVVQRQITIHVEWLAEVAVLKLFAATTGTRIVARILDTGVQRLLSFA